MRNLHKVQLKQWRRWSNQARSVFNDTYAYMAGNQNEFLHPKAKRNVKAHWKTTAWNAAWVAADAADAWVPTKGPRSART